MPICNNARRPKDKPWIRACFLMSGFFLICSKLCNVASPIALKVGVGGAGRTHQVDHVLKARLCVSTP